MTDPMLAEVRAAEAAAADAAAAGAELEKRMLEGDESVTPDDFVKLDSWSRFTALRLEAARKRAAKSIEAARVKGVRDLRSAVLKQSLPTGEALAKKLRAVDDAAREFVALAAETNTAIQGWTDQLHGLGVKPNATEQGIGVLAGGGLRVDDLQINVVDASKYLGLILRPSGYSERLLPLDGAARDAAYEELSARGKEN